MRELVLVLPDLFLQADAARQSAGAALTALRFDAPRVLRGGWRGMLARGVGREDLALVDEASIIDAALRLAAGTASGGVASVQAIAAAELGAAELDAGEPWIATPLHLVAGLKTVHFPLNGVLQVAVAEAAELADEFAKIFGGDGLELVPAGSAGFILRGLETGGAATLDPARLVGGSLEEAQPTGAGSAVLRALSSELEMWLHALPLNRRRMARGEAPVSTLWLWGGGQPARAPLEVRPAQQAPRWERLFGEDAWVQALGRLAGVTVASVPRPWVAPRGVESCCLVVPLADRGLESLDREFIGPLVRDLHAGRLATLVIAANDRWVAVNAADRFKFWRPKRSAFAATLDSLA